MIKTKFVMNMRLDDQEEAIIAEKMNQTGLGKAAAVRLIIREWSEMKKQYITVPVAGVIRGEKVDMVVPQGDLIVGDSGNAPATETLDEQIERSR